MATPDKPPRLRRALTDFAVAWGVACLLFAALVIAAHLFLVARYSQERVFDHHSRLTPSQQAAYAKWKNEDLDRMLTWTWSPGWIYEPWLGFREKPRRSEFVNVSQDGVRATAGGARSLADYAPGSVFLFGGSTLFGYGVADGETIASHLQALLGAEARVFNFGRAFYYSEQENMLLESLLRAGLRPEVAVFVDGLNERCDLDVYQRELALLYARAQSAYEWHWTDAVRPLAFLADKLAKRGRPAGDPAFSVDLQRLDCARHGRQVPLKDIVAQNLERRALLCAQYGLRCVTFVQPIAGLHGSHPDFVQHSERARRALRLKFEHLSATFGEKGLVDATPALDGLAAPAYVDGLHYSSEAGRAIAMRLLRHVRER
jgi:hypothetical protein